MQIAPQKPAVAAPHQPKSENRVWIRYRCEIQALCQETKPDRLKRNRFNYKDLKKRWSARVTDVSRGGMKMEVNSPFKPGALLFLDLDAGPSERRRTLQARVVHATRQQDTWKLGCVFTKPLAERELKELLMFAAPADQSPSLLRAVFSRLELVFARLWSRLARPKRPD